MHLIELETAKDLIAPLARDMSNILAKVVIAYVALFAILQKSCDVFTGFKINEDRIGRTNSVKCTDLVINSEAKVSNMCKHNRAIKPKILTADLSELASVCDRDTDNITQTELLLSLRNGMFGGGEGTERDCNAFCVFNIIGKKDSHFRWSRLSRCWRKFAGHSCHGASPSERLYAEKRKSSTCGSSIPIRAILNKENKTDVITLPSKKEEISNEKLLSIEVQDDGQIWTIAEHVKVNATRRHHASESNTVYLSGAQLW